MDPASPVSRKAQGLHLLPSEVGGKGGQVPLPQADFAQQGTDGHGHQAAEPETAPAPTPIAQPFEKEPHLPQFGRWLGQSGG